MRETTTCRETETDTKTGTQAATEAGPWRTAGLCAGPDESNEAGAVAGLLVSARAAPARGPLQSPYNTAQGTQEVKTGDFSLAMAGQGVKPRPMVGLRLSYQYTFGPRMAAGRGFGRDLGVTYSGA